MSETVKRIFIFIAGAGLGAFATWQFLKNKYEQIANEEIASVKEAYNKKMIFLPTSLKKTNFRKNIMKKQPTENGLKLRYLLKKRLANTKKSYLTIQTMKMKKRKV